MEKMQKEQIKKKFQNENDRCFNNCKPLEDNIIKIVNIIDKKLEKISIMRGELDDFNTSPTSHAFNKIVASDKYPSNSYEMDILKLGSVESSISKSIYDEKISLVEFICDSLNCKNGQVTFGNPLSPLSRFDGKEYLKRNVIIHLGDLVTNLKKSEIENGVVFPKFVFGNFKLYLPISTDISKITYPEYISGEIMISPNNGKFSE